MTDDRAGVLAPPPLIFLGFLLVGLAFHFGCCPLPTGLPQVVRLGGAALLIGAGLALILAAGGRFVRAGTAIRPWQPTTRIVQSGPYRFTRNPMYLGMTFLYCGVALWADSGAPLLLLFPLLETIKRGVILREERYLERKFGDEYLQYKAKVRRWL